MKSLEEMTDSELSQKCFEAGKALMDVSNETRNMAQLVLLEVASRLSIHPAQRIADATECVVTKDEDGAWRLWDTTYTPEIHKDGYWYHGFPTMVFADINLIDDPRPWQESIYKPSIERPKNETP